MSKSHTSNPNGRQSNDTAGRSGTTAGSPCAFGIPYPLTPPIARPSQDTAHAPVTSMLGDIGHFAATGSTFNNSAGNQQNYTINISSARKPLRLLTTLKACLTIYYCFYVVDVLSHHLGSTSISPSAVYSPPSAEISPTQIQRMQHHFEISHAQAVVRMFGNISHFHPSRFPSNGVAEALCFPGHVFATLHNISKPSCGPLLSQAAGVVLTIFRGVQVCIPHY